MTYRTLRIAAWLAAPLLAALTFHSWLASRDEQRRLRATLAAQQQLLDAADARERARQSALADSLAQIENLKRATKTPEQIVRELPKYLPLPQPITLGRRSLVAPSGAEGSSDIADGRGAHSNLPGSSAIRIGGRPESSSSAQFHPQPMVEVGRDGPASSTQESSQGSNGPKRIAIPLAQSEIEGSESAQTDESREPSSRKPPQSPDDNIPSAPTAQIPAGDLKPLFDFIQDCRACQAQLAAAQQNAADDAAKIAALTRERDAALTAARGGTFWRRLRRNALWFAVGAGAGAVAGLAASH